MSKDFGIVAPGSTLYIEFDSFDSSGGSVTLSGLLASDIEVYRNGSTTQRSSDSGYSLLDTDGIDFDSLTGIHGLSIDLSDNTDAGFWVAGAHYRVVVSTVTVDSQTISFTAATFRIGYPTAVLNTTIATLASQTSFTLTAGPAEADALNNMWAIIHDAASAVQASPVQISDYSATTKTVTLAAVATFTVAAGDNFCLIGPMPLVPTVTGRTLDVSDTGEAGLDWANVGSPTTTVGLTGTTISTSQAVASVTGSVGSLGAQAKLDVNAEADTAISDAALATAAALATVDANVDTLLTRITSTLFSGITSLAEWLGLMAGKQTPDATALAEIKATGAGSGTYDATTDSQEAVADAGGGGGGDATAANQTTIITHLTDIKGTGFSKDTHSLPQCLTATGFSTLDDAGVRSAVGLATANLDTQLGDIPTVAEFEARTLVAAAYFDPAADTVAHVTLVDTTTTNTDMRGTDGANTTVPDSAGTAAALHATTDAAIAALNNLSTSDIDARLAAIGLDHLVSASVAGADIADNSIIAKLVSKSATADWDDFVNTTDSLQAIRDNQAAGDATAANQTTIINHLADIKGTGFVVDTHSLPQCLTATGFSTHTAADAADAVFDEATAGHVAAGSFGKLLADVLADTNELQVDDVPALIAALNNLSAAEVNAEVLDVLATDTLIDGKTFQAAVRYIAAALAGKVSGAKTGTETVLGLDGATTRIVYTVDSSGNRTAVSYD